MQGLTGETLDTTVLRPEARRLSIWVVAVAILAGALIRAQQAPGNAQPSRFQIQTQTQTPPEAKPEAKDEPKEAPAPAAEAAKPALRAATPADFRKQSVDGYTILNGAKWIPGNRKMGRPKTLWTAYMHGIVDHFAAPIGWQALLGDDARAVKLLDSRTLLDAVPFKKTNMPSLRLSAGQSFVTPLPLPVDVGGRVRVFLWAMGKGERTVTRSWHTTAGLDLVLRGASGKTVHTRSTALGMQGSFPWHCYYVDFLALAPVPESRPASPDGGGQQVAEVADQAPKGGCFLRFYNRTNGTLWFSALSWEIVGEDNTYANDEMQDPVSGSLSPNPLYDPLPYHLCTPMGKLFKWHFLQGSKIGLQGHTIDITTKAGLATYLKDVAAKDPHQLSFAVSALPTWFRYGTELQVLPKLEAGWLEALGKGVAALQDSETGLWGYAGCQGSIAVTWRIVDGVFGAQRIPRHDRPDIATPWRSAGSTELPNAARLVDKVLSMQETYRGRGGRSIRAAWSLSAYHAPGRSTVKTSKQRCSLAATANAISLLRLAARHAGKAYSSRSESAIRDAFRYVLDRCITADGLWKQSDTDRSPTGDGFMPQLIDATQYLERRTLATVPRPDVKASPVRKGVTELQWLGPPDRCVAMRIYCAPLGTGTMAVTESHLVGIVQRGPGKLPDVDPLILTETLRSASGQRWGTRWDCFGEQTYLTWKLGLLPQSLAVTVGGDPIRITVGKPAEKEVFVAGVSWYGEESPLRKIELVDLGDGEAEGDKEDEEGGDEKGEEEGEEKESEKPDAPPAEQPAEAAPEPAEE